LKGQIVGEEVLWWRHVCVPVPRSCPGSLFPTGRSWRTPT